MKRTTQADQVVEALRKKGGYATLKDLYNLVPHNEWGTQTPFATIRRILQKDPQSRFFRIRPGLWGLTELKEKILEQLSIDESASPKQVAEFDHSYYQGLVVEIGNLREFKTFVPKQDRNKKFIQYKKLGDIITLREIYQFTYKKVVKRASTVDVIWFNERKMPHAFWEIEHTTDFTNSLLKFVEFQDFRVNFYIVADSTRRNQFEERIKQSAFKPIEKWVRFIDYEKLAELHAAAKAYPQVQEL
jgi:hypothetical protein